MDVQGVVVEGELKHQEVAVCSYKADFNVLCDTGVIESELSCRDRTTAGWVFSYTGLPLDPSHYYYRRLKKRYNRSYKGMETIRHLYDMVVCEEMPYVAIKNTQLIPTLVKLDIPFICLPERVSHTLSHVYQLCAMNACRFHIVDRSKCAKAKAFGLFNLLLLQNT